MCALASDRLRERYVWLGISLHLSCAWAYHVRGGYKTMAYTFTTHPAIRMGAGGVQHCHAVQRPLMGAVDRLDPGQR